MSGDDFIAIVLLAFILTIYYSFAGLAFFIIISNTRRYIIIDLISYLICLISILFATYQCFSDFQVPFRSIGTWLLITAPFYFIIFKNIKDRIKNFKSRKV